MKKAGIFLLGLIFIILQFSFHPNPEAGGCKFEFAILKKTDTAYISELHFCDYRSSEFLDDIAKQYQDTISAKDLRDLKYELLIVSNGVYVRGDTKEPSRLNMEKTRKQMRKLLKKKHKKVLDVKTNN